MRVSFVRFSDFLCYTFLDLQLTSFQNNNNNMKTLLLLVLALHPLHHEAEGRGVCGGHPGEPEVTETSGVTGLVFTLPWAWNCLS